MKKPANYWNKENCANEARKYNSKVEFIRCNMSAYNSAVKNGWLNEITKHMVRPLSYNMKWTKEACKNEALLYSSRKEFHLKSGAAYISAYTNGWLDEICLHMQRPVNSNTIWTVELCTIEALKYETRKDFNEKSKGAYLAATKYGIIENICSHMKACGSLTKRCVYIYEFEDNHAYVGLTYDFDKRHNQHMRHTKSAVYKHIQKTGLIPKHIMVSDSYVDVYLAKELEKEYYYKYKDAGWQMLNSNRTGGTGWCKLPINNVDINL